MKLLRLLIAWTAYARESPTDWSKTIDKHLVDVGIKRLKSDPCVYTDSECGVIFVLTLCFDTLSCSESTSCFTAKEG